MPKGLGFSDEEYDRKNATYSGRTIVDKESYYEDRNNMNKHRTRGYNPAQPMQSDQNRASRRATYQSEAAHDPSWESADRQTNAVQFEEDFKNDLDNAPGVYDNPDDYSLVNVQAFEPILKKWKQRAKRYGLSEEEAEKIMFEFVED